MKNIIVTSVIIIATLETFQNNRLSIIIVANIDSFLPWTKNRLKRKKRKHRIQSPIQLFEPRTARGILHLFLLLLLFRIDLPGKQKTTLLYYPLRYQDVVTAIPITRDITIPLPSPLPSTHARHVQAISTSCERVSRYWRREIDTVDTAIRIFISRYCQMFSSYCDHYTLFSLWFHSIEASIEKKRSLSLSLSYHNNRKRLISSNSLRKEIQSRVSLSIPLSKFLGFRVQRHPRVHRTREEAATIPPPFLFPGDDEVTRRRRGDISRLKSRTTKDRLC